MIERGIVRLLRKASNSSKSAEQLRCELELPAGTKRVQQLSSSCPNLKYKKLETGLRLTKRHVAEQLKFAYEIVDLGAKWEDIAFSDEKNFNLDGPDGFSYYRNDLQKEPRFFSKRNFGDGFTVWIDFSFKRRSNLMIMEGNQNSEKYVKILEDQLVPLNMLFLWRNIVYQQENASIHTSRTNP